MGTSVLGLASDVCRKYALSIMGLTIGKKKPKKYVDASSIPTVLALFAISEKIEADITISGGAEISFTAVTNIHIIEGQLINLHSSNLPGFHTSVSEGGTSSEILIKSDKFTSAYQIIGPSEVLLDPPILTEQSSHAFVMKGPETIAGSVNGFLNVASDLGSAAVSFGEFSTLTEDSATVANFYLLEGSDANLASVGVSYTSAELLTTTGSTNLVNTANQSAWLVEESNSTFDYMENTTFATFDTFVGAKSISNTYKIDGVVLDIADFAVFTPVYQYDFLDGYPYLSLHWENDAGELLEVVEWANEAFNSTTLSLQDGNSLIYGGSTDTPATLVFEEIHSGDVASDEVTQVAATDLSFKVFEGVLPTISNYSVGDRVVNIAYVPQIDKDRLSIGDLVGALKMEQVLVTTNELGIDMLYNNGLVYTIEDQQGVYGSLSLMPSYAFFDSFGFYNIENNSSWQYILDNTDPDTIALNSGQIAIDAFTINISDGISTSSVEIQISVEGVELFYYTDNGDNIITTEGGSWISALAGDDIVDLVVDGIWDKGYAAKNIETQQKISLEGFNRFSDVIDGGADSDILKLTSGDDAFFIDDIYSSHHRSLALSATKQGLDSTARIANIEVINAGTGNDIVDLSSTNFILTNAIEINGEVGDDILWGSNGDDTINGGEGNDTIFGGSGNNTLTGGAGSNVFQFTVASGNDMITDFDIHKDTIEFYYPKGEGLTDIHLENEILKWGVGDIAENGFKITNYVSIDLSTSISDADLAILHTSLLGFDKELLASEVQLFKETLSALNITEPSDIDIKMDATPSIDTDLLSIGNLVEALTMNPMLYLETSLGTNAMYANGITYYIEDQQGVYGSFGFGFPLEGDFKLSNISTGKTDLRSLIDPLNDVSAARYATDYATMHLTNGFSGNWPTWYYVLDNDDIDTINATVDSTHVDSFTIKATNGVDVVSQQIDIDIFEDVGPPFDKNTMLGQLQEGVSVDESVLTMLDYTGVSVDDLNSFDSFITFVEII